MIDGEGVRSAATAATLDDLFRRAGVRHPHTLALADPPNREAFTDGAPRKLSFAQADRAISACAARLRGLGLQTDSIVAMHLPNTVESIITFMGVLRAGMIAVPLPLLWRKAEIRSALGRVGAKAIVTCCRIGTDEQAEIAMQTAADLFSVRHVCGFGHGLPDGLVSLDDVFSSDGVVAVSPRIGRDTSVAAITFNLDAAGFVPISRSHVELVAGGLEIVWATGGYSGCASAVDHPDHFVRRYRAHNDALAVMRRRPALAPWL
jgi:non-ribosomal peptide synthetase component E (peptide arylation enzyme)